MKRSFKLPAALSAGLYTLMAAAPAFAEEVFYDGSEDLFTGIW